MRNVVMGRRTLVSVLAAGVAALALAACGAEKPEDESGAAGGDDFPTKPIDVIIGSEPGGTLDLQFRSIQKYWEKELGVSLVPKYRDGGAGNIGRTALIKAGGDGYAIGAIGLEQLVFAIETGIAEHTLDDFSYLGRQVFQPVTIVVRSDSKYRTMKDLVADAKARPGKVRVGMSNIASDKGLTMLLIEQATGAEFNLVPFESGGAARTALLAGDIEAVGTNVFTALELGDEIRTLAVHSPENRFPDITDKAPPLAEAIGKDLGVEVSGGSGIWFAPASLKTEHPERFEFIASALKRAIENPEYRKSLKQRADEVAYLTPEETEKLAREFTAAVQERKALFEERQGN